ncbi:MAG: class B sortase [Acetobacter sp.]|nr:class B sortase [Bacteroides sp.]MCM1340823.1 class B sortase [Acetobacter sp.]MCM1432620.1 class B sortase [Clostridiales bacterium]
MITICLIIFAIVLCYCIYNFNVDTQDQKQFDDMAQTVVLDEDNETDNGVETLIAENSDCIGWLIISGTKIDYPVMQTKDNPQYYLRRNFNKQYSYLGTPFMDAKCDMNYDNNLIIYGHNMKDGKMFADLLKYRDKEYCESHSIINFITPNGVQEYEVIAVCKVKSDDEWYGYTCQKDTESFNNLISHIKDKSLYQTDKSVEYGDCFITLSTCEYSQNNGRFILIAKRSDANV